MSVLSKADAVSKITLRIVEVDECHLIGEHIAAGLDSCGEFVSGRACSPEGDEETYEVQAGLGIGRSRCGEASQFLFCIVKTTLGNVELNELAREVAAGCRPVSSRALRPAAGRPFLAKIWTFSSEILGSSFASAETVLRR